MDIIFKTKKNNVQNCYDYCKLSIIRSLRNLPYLIEDWKALPIRHFRYLICGG